MRIKLAVACVCLVARWPCPRLARPPHRTSARDFRPTTAATTHVPSTSGCGPAEQGDPAAEAGIGFLFHKGLGVAQDDAEAATWFVKAAEQGQAEAQLLLGTLFFFRARRAAKLCVGLRVVRHRRNQRSVRCVRNVATPPWSTCRQAKCSNHSRSSLNGSDITLIPPPSWQLVPMSALVQIWQRPNKSGPCYRRAADQNCRWPLGDEA